MRELNATQVCAIWGFTSLLSRLYLILQSRKGFRCFTFTAQARGLSILDTSFRIWIYRSDLNPSLTRIILRNFLQIRWILNLSSDILVN